ncbi:heavy-metal-associated domain-containing protein [Psychrobacter sp. APC 3281]|uniref:heavy-metal-associated domain-containing protein n=1 Tax=Psychrobacter sp. APC 3281 TaxID=3035190 RepID=UPI0025B584AD|nr:heavy-metal-associated domain-containing protein [Psychrobacter sp. APC 3281]MDN3446428.1 heavy-metal-associated domain-containing protein [Psychrobacter sp. APC 3281]
MAIQMAQVSIENIDDAEGLNSVMTALKNISGVTTINLDPKHNVATVSYDDTDTSIHALTAAISMVDYATQPFPIDSPQNPHHNDL